MIKNLLWLILIGSCAFVCICIAQDNEVIIIDETPYACGNVFMLQASFNGVVRKELARDVCNFNINEKGQFVMRAENQTWYKGSIDAFLTVKKQSIKAPSERDKQSTYATISNSGKRIAWAIGFGKTELVIEEYKGENPSILRKILSDGIILMPSWSPDNTLLAFYEAPSTAVVRDGYSLKILKVDDPDSQPITLAPPSKPTRLTPTRTEPILWAPDGRHLLFEASYNKDDSFTGSAYVVSVDGTDLKPSPDGTWDQDGQRVHNIDRENDDLVIAETDILQEGHNGSKRIRQYLQLAGRPDIIAISPSANRVAYFRNDKEIYIYDILSEQLIPCGQMNSPLGRLLFIYPGGRYPSEH
jgi:hypothetical protein